MYTQAMDLQEPGADKARAAARAAHRARGLHA